MDKLIGKIEEAYCTVTFDPARVVFVVRLEDGTRVSCKHKLDDKSAAKNAAGFASLGLPWPKGLLDLSSVIGREVEVRTSDYNGKTYHFLAVFRAEQPASESEVNAIVNQLAGVAAETDPDIPF